MELRFEGRLTGEFVGYAQGRVYELSNGEKWRQEDRTDEPCWRDRPKVWLYWSQSLGSWHLDVEGTSATVRVVPNHVRIVTGAY